MNEIGKNFKETRLSSSLNIAEVSSDTGIPEEALEQIEDGSIGSFKDIFKLKEYLSTYAKYLGLDANKVIDEFNEYMFEYTSKIPLANLEKEIEEKERAEKLENTQDIKIMSPYLKPKEESPVYKYVLIAIAIIVLIAVIMIWAIKVVSWKGVLKNENELT